MTGVTGSGGGVFFAGFPLRTVGNGGQVAASRSSALRTGAADAAAGIVKNHPFLDGNKRTGFMLGAAFLERNGLEFHATEAEAVVRTLALAAGEMTEAAYAEWLKANSSRA